jgi:hypothetical protein
VLASGQIVAVPFLPFAFVIDLHDNISMGGKIFQRAGYAFGGLAGGELAAFVVLERLEKWLGTGG